MLRSLRLSSRLQLLIVLFSFLFIGFGAMSLRALDEVKVGGDIYRRLATSKDLTADLMPPQLYIIESYLICFELEAATRPADIQDLRQQLENLAGRYEEQYQAWLKRLSGQPDTAALLEASHRSADHFHQLALTRLVPAIQQARPAQRSEVMRQLTALFERHRQEVDQAVIHAREQERDTELSVAQRIDKDRLQLLAVAVLLLLLSLALARRILRSITGPLDSAVAMAGRIASGDLTPLPPPAHDDEPAKLLKALNAMAVQLQGHMAALQQQELRTRQSRALLQDLITTTDLIVVGVDNQGRIQLFNEAAARSSACPAQQAVGQDWAPFRDRLSPEMEVAPTQALPAAPGQMLKPAVSYEITNLQGDRRRVIWRSSQHQVGAQSLDGSELAVLHLGLDVTDAWQAQQQVRQAMASADSAWQHRRALLRRISHGFQAPMNTLLGMCSLSAQQPPDDPRQSHYLSRIRLAAHHLVNQLGNAVDLIRLEDGRLRLEQVCFGVQEVLDEVLTDTVLQADAKGLQLLLKPTEEALLQLVGDPMRLGQAIRALVHLSIDCSREGQQILVQAATRCPAPGGPIELRIEVGNPGSGLAPEDLVDLLGPPEASTRLPADVPDLSLVRQLVELMRGQLWIDIQADGGMRLVMTAQLLPAPTPLPTASPASGGLGSLRVLLLDPDPDACEILSGWLDTLKVPHAVTQHLDHALDALQSAQAAQQPFEVLLFDWPAQDAAARQGLRELQNGPGPGAGLSYVMTLSGLDEDPHDRADAPACDEILHKPLRLAALLASLRRCRARHPGR